MKKYWAQFISSQIKHFFVPFLEPENFKGKTKKYDVDGIWTLAFRDDQPCKATEAMVIEEIEALAKFCWHMK